MAHTQAMSTQAIDRAHRPQYCYRSMTEVRSYFQTLVAIDEKPQHFQPGQVIFEAGEIGKEMYVVRTGTVMLRSGGRTLEEVGPGGVIGEMALIDSSPRSAQAVAGEDCSVTMVNEYTLLELVKKVPGFSLEIMRIMAGRLRRVTASFAKPAAPAPSRPRSKAKAKKPAARPAAKKKKKK
jgi:CRP/FNR family transcriptional regulator, cyclic AMP receptor protein